MTVDDFQKIDVHFSESQFLASSNYMVKKLFHAISLNQLEDVNHFINDSVYQKFQGMIASSLEKNAKLVYDEVNVQSEVESIRQILNTYEIVVKAHCKYCKYFTSMDGKVIGGSSTNRMSITHQVVFQKEVDSQRQIVNRCLGCGASFNIKESGKCPNCGRIYDLEKFDYIIVKFE